MAFEVDVWQWHQDYGTWINNDMMPEQKAMNFAIFLDDVNQYNGLLMFIPGSHKRGVLKAGHDLTQQAKPCGRLITIDPPTCRKGWGKRGRNRQSSRTCEFHDSFSWVPGPQFHK